MADVLRLVTKADAPAVPKGLTKAARAEWDRVAPVLRDRGGLPGEREPLLVAYCNAMALIAECDKSLSKRGGLMIKGANGIERVHPLFGAQNRPVVEALVRDRLPRFADGLMPDLGALTAGSLASQETAMRAMPTPNLGPDHKPGFNTDITIKGGEKTGVESSMGPRGPRMEITLDKMVASMLLGGPDTRAALKKLGSGNLTGR